MGSNHDAMAAGAANYGHVLDALGRAGTPAIFTQTGGSCPALEIRLDTGHTVLVTEADDCLPWQVAEHRSWGVGLYPPHSEYDQGPDRFLDSDDPSTAALLTLVGELLRQPSISTDRSTAGSTRPPAAAPNSDGVGDAQQTSVPSHPAHPSPATSEPQP